MSFAKAAPVVISILIILTVAYLRDRSRTFAVIAGTMPINLPLTLWITFGGTNSSATDISNFVRSLFLAMIATMLWMLVVWLTTRIGWGLLPAIASGYAVWALLLASLIWFGYLTVKV